MLALTWLECYKMLASKYYIWSLLISLGLCLGTIQISRAEEKGTKPIDESFYIEQPLGRKVAVTLGGLALIGAEIWWFLGKHSRKSG